MILIEGNREALYQWDLNQRVILRDFAVGTEVHFENSNIKEECCPVLISYEKDGIIYADIPNYHLQAKGILCAYIYVKEENSKSYTKHYVEFIIIPRPKPSDYVYTETEVKRWETLKEQISHKADENHTHTAKDVGALSDTTTIPTKVSELENDSGYLTAHQDISGKANKDLSNIDDETFKNKAEQAGVGGDTVNVDLKYSPESENAQSGKAVAEAVSSKENAFVCVGSMVISSNTIFPYVTYEELEGLSDCVVYVLAGSDPVFTHLTHYDLMGQQFYGISFEASGYYFSINITSDTKWMVTRRPLNIIDDKADKPSFATFTNSSTLILNHNQEARSDEAITELVLSVQDNIADTYHSTFSFTTGDTITIAYPATPIIWKGDDCDNEGSFTPEPNTGYEISIKRLGNRTITEDDGTETVIPNLVARVGVYL